MVQLHVMYHKRGIVDPDGTNGGNDWGTSPVTSRWTPETTNLAHYFWQCIYRSVLVCRCCYGTVQKEGRPDGESTDCCNCVSSWLLTPDPASGLTPSPPWMPACLWCASDTNSRGGSEAFETDPPQVTSGTFTDIKAGKNAHKRCLKNAVWKRLLILLTWPRNTINCAASVWYS